MHPGSNHTLVEEERGAICHISVKRGRSLSGSDDIRVEGGQRGHEEHAGSGR